MDQKNDDKKFLSFTLSSSKNASKKINRSANCSTFQKWFKLYKKRDLKNVCLLVLLAEGHFSALCSCNIGLRKATEFSRRAEIFTAKNAMPIAKTAR